MVATCVEDYISLRNPGDLIVEAKEMGSFVTMLCFTCGSRCQSYAEVTSVDPVSLSGSVVCLGCFEEYRIEEGKAIAA